MAPLFRIIEVTPGGSLELNDITVSGGNTTTSGGGVLNAGDLEWNSGSVRNNAAVTAGGGIANFGGTVVINDTSVTGNQAGNNGGGLANISPGGDITLNSGRVTHNGSALGGGISNFASVRLRGSRVTDNAAQVVGGGIANLGTVLNQGSTITNNQPDNCAFNPVPDCVG